ncbi:MAG: hypothetical protein RI957_1528 [Verrucomicrobiota bacterium]|jgi:uncharacterized RDD family membrane protein YckC
MKAWIIKNGEKTGPFEISQVVRKLESGECDGETYGWLEGMKDWQPLSTIPEFSRVNDDSPLDEQSTAPTIPVPMDPQSVSGALPISQSGGSLLIRRFFARWFDLLLWSSIYMCAMHLSGANLKQMMMNFWFNYLMMIVWILAEAAMLHVWGATPGKWLLGLRVGRVDGSLLPVGLSLLRSIRVYLMGMGMSHPVLLPLCHGFSWWFVRKHGSTLWDGSSGILVSLRSITPWRWLAFSFAAFLVMNVSGMILEPVSRELFRELFPQQAQWLDAQQPPATPKK